MMLLFTMKEIFPSTNTTLCIHKISQPPSPHRTTGTLTSFWRGVARNSHVHVNDLWYTMNVRGNVRQMGWSNLQYFLRETLAIGRSLDLFCNWNCVKIVEILTSSAFLENKKTNKKKSSLEKRHLCDQGLHFTLKSVKESDSMAHWHTLHHSVKVLHWTDNEGYMCF